MRASVCGQGTASRIHLLPRGLHQSFCSQEQSLRPTKLNLASRLNAIMSDAQRTFDPEGDVVLRLHYPPSNDNTPDHDGLGLPIALASTSIHEPASPASSTNSDVIFTPTSTVTLRAPSIRSGRPVNMRVSSRHLILASPVFKAIIESRLPAGQTTSQPRAEITLHNDDPGAFEILMNIMHNHVRKVPDRVDLEMMVKLSVLVDKYQVWQVMGLYVEMWMLKLHDSMPTSYTSDIMSWLSISWVFKLREDFKRVSRIAQQESTAKLTNNGPNPLPVPRTIIGNAEPRRYLAQHLS